MSLNLFLRKNFAPDGGRMSGDGRHQEAIYSGNLNAGPKKAFSLR
jgi:hypothetical protein